VSTVDTSLRHRQLKAHHDSHGLLGLLRALRTTQELTRPHALCRDTIKGISVGKLIKGYR
jgi:hypothetical protein